MKATVTVGVTVSCWPLKKFLIFPENPGVRACSVAAEPGIGAVCTTCARKSTRIAATIKVRNGADVVIAELDFGVVDIDRYKRIVLGEDKSEGVL